MVFIGDSSRRRLFLSQPTRCTDIGFVDVEFRIGIPFHRDRSFAEIDVVDVAAVNLNPVPDSSV